MKLRDLPTLLLAIPQWQQSALLHERQLVPGQTTTTSLYLQKSAYDQDASLEFLDEGDTYDGDSAIRNELKRELTLLAAITNRGEYTSNDEREVILDVITQLEALNPSKDPAKDCIGNWDLCLSSTQFFRSSPFFQALRVAVGESNREVVDDVMEFHDRATSAIRVGRVRQTITRDSLRSEVDLEVGLLPGIPMRAKATIITDAEVIQSSGRALNLRVISTEVKSASSIPFLDQLLDDANLKIPVGNFYASIRGANPDIQMNTDYVDDTLRISRDIDDNFFVYTRD